MSEFKIPPVSTLIGSTLPNFVHILSKNKVSPRYYINIFITLLIIIIATPFHFFEWFYYKIKLKKYVLNKPPIFIIGHWRSGTSLLHNVIS